MGIFLLSAAAQADRIIFAPSATKVLFKNVRLEHMWEPTKRDRHDTFLAAGLTKDIEVEFQLHRFDRSISLGTFGLSYLFVPAIVDTAPGIAFGIQDAMDRTRDGRMYYFALTYRMGLDGDFNSKTPMELTLGGGFGRRSGMFMGVQLPFTWQFRLLAEHDLRRVNAGFEFRPFQGFAARAVWREGQSLLSVRYTAKF
jgi:hypothetical protein